MKHLECPCGLKVEIRGKIPGERERKTGFSAVACHDGSTVWLCPECHRKARKLAKELMAIVKNEYVYWPSLLRED